MRCSIPAQGRLEPWMPFPWRAKSIVEAIPSAGEGLEKPSREPCQGPGETLAMRPVLPLSPGTMRP